MSDYPPTPELDRLKTIKSDSQIIGEFLDWLQNESKYVLAEYSEQWGCPLFKTSSSMEQILAEYFGIDLKAVSAEKDAVYEWMRALQ